MALSKGDSFSVVLVRESPSPSLSLLPGGKKGEREREKERKRGGEEASKQAVTWSTEEPWKISCSLKKLWTSYGIQIPKYFTSTKCQLLES